MSYQTLAGGNRDLAVQLWICAALACVALGMAKGEEKPAVQKPIPEPPGHHMETAPAGEVWTKENRQGAAIQAVAMLIRRIPMDQLSETARKLVELSDEKALADKGKLDLSQSMKWRAMQALDIDLSLIPAVNGAEYRLWQVVALGGNLPRPLGTHGKTEIQQGQLDRWLYLDSSPDDWSETK